MSDKQIIRRTETRLSHEAAIEIRRNPPRILNYAEAASFTTLSVRKLRQEVATGRIRARQSGKRILFRIEDLEEDLAGLPVVMS